MCRPSFVVVCAEGSVPIGPAQSSPTPPAYAASQLQLLTQKPYHYPSQDDSQESQAGRQFSQDGSEVCAA